jgi:subtilisin-like proprotein convertase family protein
MGQMISGKARRMAIAVVTLGALGAATMGSSTASGMLLSKTYTKGAGGSQGGVPIAIPDGAGPSTQIVRSGIAVKKLNPRGKIIDVNVGVRATHPFAADLEFYLATPRGVIGLSSDNGGNANNYGGLFASCAGQFTLFDSDVPTLISTPGLEAPFPGSFAPEESLNSLDGLGGKKATNATWSLLVEDDDPGHAAGTLDCWKLTIRETNPKK